MPEDKTNSKRGIGRVMPKWLKRSLLWLYNRPARINYRLFELAMKGTLPCPDKFFLKWMYRNFTGLKLNLEHPVTYQDKLNWMKLYYRNPLFTTLVDKYAVREWVAEKIGAEYLVPLYGVYDKFDDIDFDKLPDKFVLKCTHDSGSVVIVKNKARMKLAAVRAKIERGLATKMFYQSREWPYKNVKPRIICEGFLEDVKSKDIIDYKFHCFGGEPKVVGVFSERQSPDGAKANFYDMDWKLQDIQDSCWPNKPGSDEKPKDFQTMVGLARVLSSGIPYVRVDFYYVNEHILFGEMTFFDSGARKLFKPFSVNELFGSWITLPNPIT